MDFRFHNAFLFGLIKMLLACMSGLAMKQVKKYAYCLSNTKSNSYCLTYFHWYVGDLKKKMSRFLLN